MLSNFLNYHVIALMGIVIGTIGGLFLAFDAIGFEKFSKYINGFRKFSKWYKKSLFRMLLFIIPFFVILTIGIYFNLKVIIGLFFPTSILLFIAISLIDHPDYCENWLNSASKDKRLGTIGFLLLVCGGIFQMISVIWQMVLEK